jgi:hypothetical protein
MTTVSRVFLGVFMLLAFASFGLAQEPNLKVYERTVETIRTPSGRLEFVTGVSPEFEVVLKTEQAELSARYKGKTLWFRPAYIPIKIVDVIVVGDKVEFVFQKTTGDSFTDERLPDEVFFAHDPRQIFPERAWAYIERSKVFVGMTKDQALASWGRPERVNKTLTRGGISEQWVYGLSTYLYFKNGRLTAAQN